MSVGSRLAVTIGVVQSRRGWRFLNEVSRS